MQVWMVHWRVGEAVYRKLEAVNHETYNENNKISQRGKSPP